MLADCLHHAIGLGAERLVDVATLTGAIMSTLGKVYSGFWADDEAWAAEVAAAADEAGELIWRMPLHRALRRAGQGQDGRRRQPVAAAHRRGLHGGGVPAPLHRRRAVGAPRHLRDGVGLGRAVRRQGRDGRDGAHAGRAARADRRRRARLPRGERDPRALPCGSSSSAPTRLTLAMPGGPGASGSRPEAHRLLTAESMVSDGDVDLRDEYASSAWRDWYSGRCARRRRRRDGRLVEPVGLGFTLLIAPAYAIGGADGRADLAGAARGARRSAWRPRWGAALVPEPWATRAALVVGLSPPALGAATAIAPARRRRSAAGRRRAAGAARARGAATVAGRSGARGWWRRCRGWRPS